MASGFVRKSDKVELEWSPPGHMSAILQIHFTFGFWTRSWEMDEWSGFQWLKPGM